MAKITAVSAPTLITALNFFKKRNVIHSVGYGDPNSGRPPQLIDINEKAGFAIAFWMEVPQIVCAALDLKCQIVHKQHSTLSGAAEKGESVKEVIDFIHETVGNAGLQIADLVGIGFATSGLIDRHTNKSLAIERLPGWEDVDIARLLSEEFKCPVFVDNDIRAASIAENHFYLKNEYRNFLYVGISEGIGMGIYNEGVIQNGHKGNAGFLGHITIVPNGAACKCGNRGCLETYSSISGIRRKIEAEYSKTVLAHCRDVQQLEKQILHLYLSGEREVVGIVDNAACLMGIGLANAIKLFDPELVIIGSDSLYRNEKIFAKVEESCRASLSGYSSKNIDIRLAEVQNDATILGMGITAINEFFHSLTR